VGWGEDERVIPPRNFTSTEETKERKRNNNANKGTLIAKKEFP
jgi:hypothetical protein